MGRLASASLFPIKGDYRGIIIIIINNNMIIIGIDPDVEKNGFAVLDTKWKSISICEYKFSEVMENLCAYRDAIGAEELRAEDVIVIIEAGWLNKSNWHYRATDTKAKVAEIGRQTGRNHQTGILIAEMCEYMGIPYKLVKPLPKFWKGKDRKITAEEFREITGYKGRTNQEGRDAGLLAWVEAGFSIKLLKR